MGRDRQFGREQACAMGRGASIGASFKGSEIETAPGVCSGRCDWEVTGTLEETRPGWAGCSPRVGRSITSLSRAGRWLSTRRRARRILRAMVSAINWESVSAFATAGGTLVLAVATFASVRSANQAARTAERALQVNLRPVLVPSRLNDPVEKMMWVDKHWTSVAGRRGSVEIEDGRIYLAMSLPNVGSGSPYSTAGGHRARGASGVSITATSTALSPGKMRRTPGGSALSSSIGISTDPIPVEFRDGARPCASPRQPL